jgi:hypothetical protein
MMLHAVLQKVFLSLQESKIVQLQAQMASGLVEIAFC